MSIESEIRNQNISDSNDNLILETQNQQNNSTNVEQGTEDEELRSLLVPDVRDLPLRPPSAVESNFVSYFAPGYYPYFSNYIEKITNCLNPKPFDLATVL